jgi:glycosyltransferase involved in cell wall biosynthesis
LENLTRLVVVTNIPAPYRVPIYNLIAEKIGSNFLVIFKAERETNRLWNLPELKFSHIFLEMNFVSKMCGYNFFHNNFDILLHLRKFMPDIVITTSFDPTSLCAWIYSVLFRGKHISMIDGWLYSERNLSFVHRMIRKFVFSRSHAYIGAGKGSVALFESYGVLREQIFQSCLCINNRKYNNNRGFHARNYHLLFSGQFIGRKNPFFFVEVCKEIKKVIPDLKVAVMGGGVLKERILKTLDEGGVDYVYLGFKRQEELPNIYKDAKLLLFPTLRDPWGIVVNEALASGTPVITSPYAGVANDLITDTQNGFIVSLDLRKWVDICIRVLSAERLWVKLSQNAKLSVKDFTFKNAADGITKAVRYAYTK